MKNRGQAALEYLMTYGWALIVIAIVVGVLVFIVSSPAGDVVCSSSSPNKVNVKASQITTPVATGDPTGTILLTNLTGGDMTGVVCFGDGVFGTAAADIQIPTGDGCLASVTSGVEITLTPDASAAAGTTHTTSGIRMGYTDYAGLDRNATITCSGPVNVTA